MPVLGESVRASRFTLLKRILLWEASGVLLATLVFPAIAVVGEGVFVGHFPPSAWMTRFELGAFWTFAAAAFMAPLTLIAFYVWGLIAGRFAILERSQPGLVVGLILLSVIVATLAGAISEWELFGQSSYWRASVDDAAQILPGVLTGVILPRWLVPSLRRGREAPNAAV